MSQASAARAALWDSLSQPWDLVIIGGGITGAGILNEAVRRGWRTLLLEARDFASGTSSRSSKLVHGGLRYLKNAQLKITIESVKERDHLLKQGKGLINRLGFLYASLRGDPLPGWVFGLGLVAYDLMARQWSHRRYDAEDLRELCPPLTARHLTGGFRYFDAQTDDARLVLRLIQQAVAGGGTALNYARVSGLLRQQDGQAAGVIIEDAAPGEARQTCEVQARAVINATGAWSDELRNQLSKPARLRPLRGSHLVLSSSRLPLTRAVSFLHPDDGRPVFAIPWEGVTIFGTTDVDHGRSLENDPCPSTEETIYLLSALQAVFPDLELQADDIQAVFAGIRPVVDTGKSNPSKESREHVVWDEDGLLTVSGGKLTTFRLMARDALKAIQGRLPAPAAGHAEAPVLVSPDDAEAWISAAGMLAPAARLRLLGRYGENARQILSTAAAADMQRIPGTPYLWGELRWSAGQESIVHLDDLLLRRLRLGLLLPEGGRELLPAIRGIAQLAAGWDDLRWQQEEAAYLEIWQNCFSPKIHLE